MPTTTATASSAGTPTTAFPATTPRSALDFLRMLADAQDKADFKAILCWQQDRFGRFSPLEASYRIYPLAQARVQLVTTDKGPIDWNDFTDWLTYSVNQHGKHEFLKDHSRNVTRGQMTAVEKGSWVGSPPYAYRVEGAEEEQAARTGRPRQGQGRATHLPRVRGGRSVDDGDCLPAKRRRSGVADRQGEGMALGAVRVILENPAYTGDFAGSRYSYGKYHTRANGAIAKANGKRVKKDAKEWVVRPDRHDAIIDRPTFEKAQTVLALHRGEDKTGRVHTARMTTPTSCPDCCGAAGAGP